MIYMIECSSLLRAEYTCANYAASVSVLYILSRLYTR